MTTKDLEQQIFEKTGKRLGIDYGFILGTHSPLMEKQEEGMFSANNQRGYSIWKKTYVQKIVEPKDFEESFDTIIDFLKNE